MILVGVAAVACSGVLSFTSGPRVVPDLGAESHCCSLVMKNKEYVLHWEIRSSRAGKASVTVSSFFMDREPVAFEQLDTGQLEFHPDKPKPLDLSFTGPRPRVRRMLSVTLQPHADPEPQPSQGSCKVCWEPER